MSCFSLKNKIIENKVEMMGLAIILIICFHSDLGDGIKEIRAIAFIKELCDIGVELFFMLSGFSLAMSFNKDGNIIHFYKKRFLRLLPSYFMVFGIWYAFLCYKDGGGILSYLWNLFFLNYYVDNDLLIWFIPVILLYYLLLPLYIKIIKYNSIFKALPFLIILIDILLKVCHIDPRLTLLRLPIFFIGANIFFENRGKCNICSLLERKSFLVILSIISIFFCYYFIYLIPGHYSWKYFFYIPLAILIVRSYKPVKAFQSALGWLGIITLEIYLLHERIQWIFDAFQFKIFPFIPLWFMSIVSIFFTLITAKYLNLFVRKITRR